MQDNQGVTPSGPGSRPSGGAAKASPAKPSIPNAELLPIADYWGGERKAYRVHLDGQAIGTVQQCYPTFERGPRQANYVTKRWRAKRPHCEYCLNDSLRASIDYPTRKRAVEQLIAEHSRFISDSDTR